MDNDEELGFGTRKIQKKRESAIIAPRFEVPQKASETPTQRPFEPMIEMDEDGELTIPKRPLTREEQEQVTCITLFKKHKENFDERILWFIIVEAQREVFHFASAFTPELKNIIERVRVIERRFSIKVPEHNRIAFDQELNGEKQG